MFLHQSTTPALRLHFSVQQSLKLFNRHICKEPRCLKLLARDLPIRISIKSCKQSASRSDLIRHLINLIDFMLILAYKAKNLPCRIVPLFLCDILIVVGEVTVVLVIQQGEIM